MNPIARFKRMTQTVIALSMLVMPFTSGIMPAAQASEAPTRNEPKIVQIVSPDYPLALDDEGNVWCKAYNAISTKEGFHPVPMVKVKGLDNVARLTTHLALKKDGTVWKINRKQSNETTNIRERESVIAGDQIPHLKNIVKVESFGEVGTAIDRDGKVWIFQYSPFKDDPNFPLFPEPVLLPKLDRIQDMAPGTMGISFLKEDGTVWAVDYFSTKAGYATLKELIPTKEPVQINGLTDITKLSLDMALKKDGTVWTWGKSNLALSNNNGTESITPIQVTELSDIVDLNSDIDHALFLKKDGTVRGWGYFTVDWEVLGRPATQVWKAFSQLEGLSNVSSVVVGNTGSTLTTDAAIKNDGTLWMWGAHHFSRVDPQPRQVQFRD